MAIKKFSENTTEQTTFDWTSDELMATEQDAVMKIASLSNYRDAVISYYEDNNIVNDRTTGGTTSTISAEQGKLTKEELDSAGQTLINLYDSSYSFIDFARTDTDPSTHSADRAWLAVEDGDYTNFSLTGVTKGEIILDDGTDYTAVSVDTRITTLEADSSTEGSVDYKVKNNAESGDFTDTSGLDSTAIGDAINEIYAEKAVANGIATLDATGKVPSSQLPVTAMEYKGSWDASGGSYPTSPDTGDYWLVSVAGTVSGIAYDVGDAIIYNGASWDHLNKIEIAEEVSLTSDRYTAPDVKNALDEIAGEGRTTETVKGNADEINNLKNSTAQIFGLDWDKTTDSYTRTDMAAGLTIGSPDGVNKVDSDFDSYYPWRGIKQVKVNSEKEILAYLGDETYDSVDGEYMTLIPQFWFQDWIDASDVRHVRISSAKLDGFYPAFLDSAGNPVEYRLVGRVPAGYDTELRSKPDMAVEVNRSYTSFITTAYAKGSWWLDDAMIRHKIGLLAGVEAGDWDVKARYGQGINSGMPYGSGSEYECVSAQTGANSIIIADTVSSFYVGMVVQIGTAYSNNSIASNRKITDVTDNGDGTQTITVDGAAFDTSLGDTIVTWGQPVPADQIDALDGGSGYILQWDSESRSHVSYRGIWDLWGNVWSFTYGFARYDGRYYVCFDQTKYDVSDPRTDAGWIDTGEGVYIDNGYQNERAPFVTDQGSVDFPISTGGGAGSGTFYAAYLYNFSSTYDGVRILRSGGIWFHGGNVSLFYVLGGLTPSYTLHYFGSRLIG